MNEYDLWMTRSPRSGRLRSEKESPKRETPLGKILDDIDLTNSVNG